MIADEIRKLDGLVNSEPFQTLYAPRIQRRCDAFLKALRDPSKARVEKLPDDYLRGWLDALEWALKMPRRLIEDEIEREVEANAELQIQLESDRLALVGPTHPDFNSGSLGV